MVLIRAGELRMGGRCSAWVTEWSGTGVGLGVGVGVGDSGGCGGGRNEGEKKGGRMEGREEGGGLSIFGALARSRVRRISRASNAEG